MANQVIFNPPVDAAIMIYGEQIVKVWAITDTQALIIFPPNSVMSQHGPSWIHTSCLTLIEKVNVQG